MIKKFIICSLCICLLTACSSKDTKENPLTNTFENSNSTIENVKEDSLISHIGAETNEDNVYLKINSDEEVEEAKKNQAEIKDISESSLLNEKEKDSDVIHNEVVVGDETAAILEGKNDDINLTTYETGSIGVDLKVGDDGKQHSTKVHPLLTLNQNCPDYENLRNTISSEKDEDIVMLFQNIVSKYTLEDLKTKEIKDSIHDESLTELQKLYGTTNFIIDLALGFEFN